jgi:hypothetical protein
MFSEFSGGIARVPEITARGGVKDRQTAVGGERVCARP